MEIYGICNRCEKTYGIGYKNSLLFSKDEVPGDMRFFRNLTENNIVVMGRNTYQSIKALPNRQVILISRSEIDLHIANTKQYASIDDFLIAYYNDKRKVYVVGGQQLYDEFFKRKLFIGMYITEVVYTKERLADTFLTCYVNSRDYNYSKVLYEGEQYKIVYYNSSNVEEQRMLQLMSKILLEGEKRQDRTGTGTFSLFGQRLEFSLENNTLPQMTTRPMWLKGVFEELMMFLRGVTDTTELEKKNIYIWQKNTSREFLDKRQLTHYVEGDMGHSYGFSFRHFGAEYRGCKEDYNGCGFDQLKTVMESLSKDPHGRRHLISLWEPNFFHKAALPPCLYCYQFYIDKNGLSCMMSQRSSDFAVAGGWNVLTGSLLTIFLAHYLKIPPYKLIWNLGDVHCYTNHYVNALEQIGRDPRVYPKIYLVDMPENIEQIAYKNIKVVNYKPHSKLEFEMSA